MAVKLWLLVCLSLSMIVAPVATAAASASADNDRRLRVAYVEFPPIEYQDENGQPAGEFIELTRKVAAEAGYELEFIYLPISRAYLYLENGQVDLWPGLTAIPELSDDVVESYVSPTAIQLSAWYLEDTVPVTRFESFNERILILIAGYTYGGLSDYLTRMPGVRITEAPNHQAAVDMLRRKRGHYLLDYQEPIRELLASDVGQKPVLEKEVRIRNAAWLFSLSKHHAITLRDEFDDAYLRLAKRGEVPPPRELKSGYVLPGFPEHLR